MISTSTASHVRVGLASSALRTRASRSSGTAVPASSSGSRPCASIASCTWQCAALGARRGAACPRRAPPCRCRSPELALQERDELRRGHRVQLDALLLTSRKSIHPRLAPYRRSVAALASRSVSALKDTSSGSRSPTSSSRRPRSMTRNAGELIAPRRLLQRAGDGEAAKRRSRAGPATECRWARAESSISCRAAVTDIPWST